MEESKSKVAWAGMTRRQGNASRETETKLIEILDEIGILLEQEANTSKLDLYDFPIFREFEVVGVVTKSNIIYIIYPSAGGGFPRVVWIDTRQETDGQPTQDDFLTYAGKLFGWKEVWVLELESKVLDLQPHVRKDEIQKVARNAVRSMIAQRDEEARLVKFNPIFEGRDFFVQNDLCFVLMPFQEPFLRLYKDQVKPTLEKAGLRVMKADDFLHPPQ